MEEEAMVKFLLQKLDSLSKHETQIFAGVEDQISRLSNIFKDIASFSEDNSTTENDTTVLSWANDLQKLTSDLENIIDDFIIQMNQENTSNELLLTDGFKAQLHDIETRLVANITKMKDLQLPAEIKGQNEDSFAGLPYYLKYCLVYCCIFPESYWIPRGRLVRLLVAEGLVQEKAGEIEEDIATENINQLINSGMLCINKTHPDAGITLMVNSTHRKFLLNENLVSIVLNSESIIPNTARRVSIYTDIKNIEPKLKNLRPRSLFLFGSQTPVNDTWLDNQWAKYLRVLDLEDSRIKSIPDTVGDLIHIAYLGLKGTDIDKIPVTVGNLQFLQTLDIRRCRNITELSATFLKNASIRHIKMLKTSVEGVKLPAGFRVWKNLLTLTGICPGGNTAAELGNLIQLRKLGVSDVAEEDVSELFASIMRMHKLISLSLEPKLGFLQEKLAVAESFVPPPFLRKLRMEGQLEKIPCWFSLMNSLTTIRLGFSNFSENPTSVLQLLPNLRKLALWRAYEVKQLGKEFCSVGGFPKLEILMIASHVLEEWTEIEEGALPSLHYLHFHNCLKLQKLPEGLQFVATLKMLKLIPLLDDHMKRLKPDGGEENYKIKNIPTISFIPMSVVRNSVCGPAAATPSTQQG